MTARWSSVVADFAERAGWTAGQAFFAVLLTSGAGDGTVNVPWRLALAMAAGAALTSVVTTMIQYLTPLRGIGFWPDLLVRLAKTFLASLVGSFGAGAFDVLTFRWSSALDLAVVTTLGALAKGFLAAGSGPQAKATPSTLPEDLYARATRHRRGVR